MPTRTKPLNIVLYATALAITCADTATAGPPLARYEDYVVPHQQVEVEPSRHLNLFCLGAGDHTVLFDAGGSDWSVVWARVQPLVAREARACVYDRAGLGYSDAAPGPRSPVAIVEDMHALIHAAQLQTPLILVGHSLGGFNVKLHAALYPNDVAALVLLEPSEERAWDRTRAAIATRFGRALAARAELRDRDAIEQIIGRYSACRDAARNADMDPASLLYRRCSDPPRSALGTKIADERKRLQVQSRYQLAQSSEIENSIYGTGASDRVYADLFKPGMLGKKPLVLLARVQEHTTDALDAVDAFQLAQLQRETVRLSREGERRSIREVSHHIELDAPEIVAETILSVSDGLKSPAHRNRQSRTPSSHRRKLPSHQPAGSGRRG